MKFLSTTKTFVTALAVYAVTSAIASAAGADLIFVASRTNGIVRYHVDKKSGTFSDVHVAAPVVNPQFFALHPTQPFLYSIDTLQTNKHKAGGVSAFRVDRATGELTPINQQLSPGGGPTHISVDHAGKNLLVANYGSGSISVFPIQADGALAAHTAFVQHSGSSIVPRRQEGPHAHQILTDPSDRFVLVCDLGLDKVLVYKFDSAKGTLEANNPPFALLKPGSGPRHLSFHPNGKFVYVINELNSTLTTFSFDKKTGAMTELQTLSTLPSDFTGNNFPAEVYVHPSGKFLYGSNRGHDSIVVCAIGEDGKLSVVQHQSTFGKIPRHFVIHPSGELLCVENQDSNDMFAFAIDAKTGMLKRRGDRVEINSPSCAVFFPGR